MLTRKHVEVQFVRFQRPTYLQENSPYAHHWQFPRERRRNMSDDRSAGLHQDRLALS